MAATLAFLIVIAGGLALLFPDRLYRPAPQEGAFPQPTVIPDEGVQRRRLEAEQNQLLAGGNGRLPIDEAMKRIVARGPHAYDPVEAKP